MKKLFALLFGICALWAPANASEADTFGVLVELADRGNAEAQYHVGMMYNNGIGTKKNGSHAFEWFQKAASSGDALGAYKLGCYYDGQGIGVVASNSSEALKYKLIAANEGYALAQHDVGILFSKEGNAERALHWWKMAAAQGYPNSLIILSRQYALGVSVPGDRSLAYAYLKLSKRALQMDLDEMAASLSQPELDKAEKFASEWTFKPTLLTLRAMKGGKAATELIESVQK